MECIVTLEQRLYRLGTEGIYTNTLFNNEYWEEYLSEFERVFILTRVGDIVEITPGWRRVDGPRVIVADLPDINNVFNLLLNYRKIKKKIQGTLGKEKIVILRTPGIVSALTWWFMKKERIFGVEVVGNPKEVFSKDVTAMRLRALYRYIFHKMQLTLCKGSIASTYVTKHYLQEMYPPGGYQTYSPNVRLYEKDYIDNKNLYERIEAKIDKIENGERIIITNIGTMQQLYKGQDIIIEAVRLLKNEDVNIEAHLVGDGKFRKQLEHLTRKNKLEERVVFKGYISDRNALHDMLDSTDIYVHPSRTEGVPRALFEAMARGLPVIVSRKGGMSEIAEDHGIIDVPDGAALAEKIKEFLSNKGLLRESAIRNFITAKHYDHIFLEERKREFLKALKRSAKDKMVKK